jgi:tRNA-dihydrouridine synthase
MIKIGNIELPEFPLLLAPMEDVSDPPFRRLCKMHGADLMYSEFISSEGLIRDAIKSRKNWIFSITKDLSEFRFLEVTKKRWLCLQELWKR